MRPDAGQVFVTFSAKFTPKPDPEIKDVLHILGERMSLVQFTFYSACQNFWIKGITWPLFVRLSDTMSSFQNPYQNIFFFRNFAQQLNVIVILSGCAELTLYFSQIVLAHKALAACGTSSENVAKILMVFSVLGKKGANPAHVASSMKNLGAMSDEVKGTQFAHLSLTPFFPPGKGRLQGEDIEELGQQQVRQVGRAGHGENAPGAGQRERAGLGGGEELEGHRGWGLAHLS